MSKSKELYERLQNNDNPLPPVQQASKNELMRPIFNIRRKRTTIELDVEIHLWLKRHALDTNDTMTDILDRVLKEYRNRVERGGSV